jgi:hypothetical protein
LYTHADNIKRALVLFYAGGTLIMQMPMSVEKKSANNLHPEKKEKN